ncbi:MAG: PAS domain S-box protein [Gammaproteobacteria bacterium]|nr:PAS domain S-box protein [Gammaproteobacteria bacterium]
MTKRPLRHEQRAGTGSAPSGKLRSFDWARSPLGTIEQWPPALRAAVDLCLNTPTPAFVYCRQDLVIPNDACIGAIGGSRTTEPGRSGRELWSNHWDAVEPLVLAVFDTGEAKCADNVQLIVERGGSLEDCYFALSSTPVIDDSDGIVGVFVLLTENADIKTEPAAAAGVSTPHVLDRVLAGIDEAFTVFDRDWRHTYINDKAVAMAGIPREQLLGRSLWDSFPQIVGSEFHQRLLALMEQQQNARFDYYSELQQRWFDVRAYPWPEGVALLVVDISERKQAEETQRANEAQLRIVSDAMPALISYVDSNGRYRFANHCYHDWFGHTPEQIVGRHLSEVLGDAVFAEIRPHMERVLAGERVTYDACLPYRQGGMRAVQASYVPDRDERGRVRGFFALVHDISERTRAEEALRESEERFRRLADTAPVMIWMTDERKRSVYFNKRWLEFIGESHEQAIAGDWTAQVHPADRPVLAQCVQAFDARAPFSMDFRMRRHDGAYRWFNDYAVPRYDADGTFRGFIGTMVDVTDRKQIEDERSHALAAEREARAEAELLRDLGKVLNSELDMRTLLQRVTDTATAAIGADLGAFFYNAVDQQGEGYRLYAVAGMPAESFAQLSLPRETALFEPTLHDESIVRCDDVTQDPRFGKSAPHFGTPSGHPPVKSYLAVPVKSRSGEVLGALFFGHQQPARFQARHERTVAGIAAQAAIAIDNARLFDVVREQAARWQATHDHAAVGICESTLDGRLIGVNDMYCAILGYSRDELLDGMRFRELTHPDDVAIDEGLFEDLKAGKISSYSLEKRYRRKDGSWIWIKLTASLVRDAQQRPLYGIGAIEDVTERRRAETVITGQKKALEQIARGEPLTAVLETLVDTFEQQSTLGAMGAILLLDNARRILRPVATGRLPKDWLSVLSDMQLDANIGALEYIDGAESVFVADIASDPHWQPARVVAEQLGFRNVWSIPIHSSGLDVFGALTIYYRVPNHPTADEMRFIDIITDTAAIAIERYEDEKSLRLQAQVLSRIHDAVITTDRVGRITRWNEGAERLFGYAAEEAIGQHASLCYASDDRNTFAQQVVTPLAHAGRHELVARLQRRSGDVLYGHVSLSLIHDERGRPSAAVAYILDMTARVTAEQELSARVRQQEAVAHLGENALAGFALQALMDEAVQLVTDTLSVDMCKLLELLPDQKTLFLRAGVGWQEGRVGKTVISAGRESHAGYTLLAATPVITADLPSETRFSDAAFLLEHNVVSGASVIVQGDNERPYGVFGVFSKRPRQFSTHDINFLQSIANVVANAIQRKQFEEKLSQARDDLEQRVTERTAELARANQQLRDEIVDRMGVETALRDSEAQYRMLFERNPLSAWVFDINTRQILAANETAVWQYGYTREEFLRMSIDDLHPSEEMSRMLDYAEQFAPETAYIGVWKHRKQDETIIDVEMFVYEVLFQGRWARLVLANDITERRRAEQEFRLIEQITRAIGEARDYEAALYAVLRQLCETTGWVWGEVWLPGSDREHMVSSPVWYCAADGLDEFRHPTREQESVSGQGIIGRAWVAKHPIWLSDVTIDDDFSRAPQARAVGVRAGIAFPVLVEREIVALLAFFLREPRREDERLVKLVSTVAAQLGLAIERKRAEELLQKSEMQLSEAQHLAHLGSWEWDVASGALKWSDELYRIYGIDPGTPLQFNDYVARLHPHDHRRVQDIIASAVRERTPFTLEERIVRQNGGEIRHLLTQGALVTDSRGEVARMVGVCLDITERKRVEERLRDYTHRLQNLSQRLLEAQETERRRIARELHDQIGQDLSVIKINLQSLKRLPPRTMVAQVDETIRVVEGVLATARNLSLELRPSMLDDLGLAAALRWYLDRQAQRGGFKLQFVADNVDGRMVPTIETACFRLAQEALTNILRHAKAQHVQVNLRLSGEELEMRIIDDGSGFDVEAARARAASGDSFGLLGMEERALLAGGSLEIISTPGHSTTVIARFPLTTTLTL